MSLPTAGERAEAKRLGLIPESLASAREVLNTIDSLPWPEPERIAVLARLAYEAKADVGPVLSAAVLERAPVESFDELLPINGIGDFRFAGLVRALAGFDVSELVPEAAAIREGWGRLADARAEIAWLRSELKKLKAATGAISEDSTMRLDDLTGSVGSQLGEFVSHLRHQKATLRLGAVRLDLQGAATAVNGNIGLDLSQPTGGSAVALTFVPATEPAAEGEGEVPDVVGYSPALARRKVEARGLLAEIAPYSGATGTPGTVAKQLPAAGEVVPAGSTVKLLVIPSEE